MRAKVRWALIAIALVALAALGFSLGQSIVGQREAEQPVAEGLAPEVSQRLKEFRRVEVRNGEKIWELKADEAQYFEERGEIEVVRPEVFFQGLGRDVQLSGDLGVVRLKGSEVSRIDLDGAIKLRMGEYLVQTEEAAYLRNEDQIVAPKGVRVIEDTMYLEGKVLLVDVKTRRIRVVGDVETTFLPGKGAPPSDVLGPPEKKKQASGDRAEQAPAPSASPGREGQA